MKLTDEDLKSFKDKLLNDYSKEQLNILAGISIEDILRYPIASDISSKLENQVDICIPCQVKAVLKYLFTEMRKEGKFKFR